MNENTLKMIINESTRELGYIKERTRERVDYPRHDFVNPVLPLKVIAGKEQQDIETTKIMYRNSFWYGQWKKHETIPSSKYIQYQVTKQSGNFNS